MRVYLVHGMGRSPAAMLLLGRRLKAAGFEPAYFGYFVTRASLDGIAKRFAAFVREREIGGEPYAIVGHSLGGIIARAASPHLPPGLSKLVMLAPPNRPPRLAKLLGKSVVFRALTQDAGAKLASESFFASLPRAACPTLVIAGSGFPAVPFHPHAQEPTDGIVSVAETHLEGAEFLTVPSIHTFLMNSPVVTSAVTKFLRDE